MCSFWIVWRIVIRMSDWYLDQLQVMTAHLSSSNGLLTTCWLSLPVTSCRGTDCIDLASAQGMIDRFQLCYVNLLVFVKPGRGGGGCVCVPPMHNNNLASHRPHLAWQQLGMMQSVCGEKITYAIKYSRTIDNGPSAVQQGSAARITIPDDGSTAGEHCPTQKYLNLIWWLDQNVDCVVILMRHRDNKFFWIIWEIFSC